MTNILHLVALLAFLWTLCQGSSIRSPIEVFKSRCYVEPVQRARCEIDDDTELECLQSGCCYDDTSALQDNGRQGMRCFQPLIAGGSDNHVCYIHSRDRQMCGDAPLSQNDCLSRGCCYAWTGNPASSVCFRANDTDSAFDTPTLMCDVPELSRQNCGTEPIVPKADCEAQGCCFAVSNLPNVPWCFATASNNDARSLKGGNTLSSLKESLVDAFATGLDSVLQGGQPDLSLAQNPNDPGWLQNIMNMISTIKPPVPYTTAGPTGAPGYGRITTSPASTSLTLSEAERKRLDYDEKSCVMTFELVQSIRGGYECSIDYANRAPCVEGVLPRLKTESECIACTKLGCCYDPSMLGSGIPHCYRNRTAVTMATTLPPTAVPTTAFTRRPRLVQLMNSLGLTVADDGSVSGGQNQAMPGFAQGQLPWGTTKMRPQSPQFGFPGGFPNANPMMFPNEFPSATGYRPNTGYNPLIPGGNIPNIIPNVDPSLGVNFENKNKGAGKFNGAFGANGFPPNLIPGLGMSSFGQNTGSAENQAMQDLLSGMIGNQRPYSQQGGNGFGNLGTQSLLSGLLGNQMPSNVPLPAGSDNQGVQSLLAGLFGNQMPNNVAQPANPLLSLFTPTQATTTTTTEEPATTEQTPTNLENTGFIPPLFEKLDQSNPANLCYSDKAGTLGGSHSARATQRIVGGNWAGRIAYWPWMASFRRNFTDDWRYKHVCGATLISKRWILTAGHCFMMYRSKGEKVFGKVEPDARSFAVHLGAYHRDLAELSLQVCAIERFVTHPKYDFRSLKHDIAVARLKDHAIINENVRPARLPIKTASLEVGTRTWVTGWGETLRVGRHNDSKLKELALPLIATNKCKKYWEKHFHQSWICTEGAYLEDACTGDSGGPLVHQDYDGRWDVIGVAIAGTKRCSTDRNDIRPGIYTNVAYYREFIDNATDGTCET